ncbi:MAG: carbohydrate kinase [Stomatobaculum sp.]|nr:carbohydrate kinase [Stomatobaculum sp.]
MRYYIGLDNGGTATKAAVFDEKGREIGTCGVATKAITPKPGFVERDMEEMWDANCAVVKGVLEKTGIDPADVAGLGISGHGKGLYLWGKDDKPARNGIISTDNRAYKYPLEWKANGIEEMAFHRSLQHSMACQPTALLSWLRDNEPESYANIKYVFECKDYIRFRLTGEAKAEVTDYSGSGLMNLWTVNFDQELLDMYGIPEVKDALPPTCRATDICGYVTEEAAAKCGLKAGTPVIGGMFDINACAIAAGVTDPSKVCMIAGTWSINEYIRKEAVIDGRVQMNSCFALPGYYLIEESSPTSAGNFEWFIRELLPELKAQEKAAGGSIYDTVDRWVEEIPVTEFVPLFLPFLMASNVHPNAKACFLGMSVSHTRAHLVRSIFEGITFCHRYHYERLMATRNEAPEVIRLAGGAARAKVWAQMFADVMNTPVQTLEANETGALGCAIAVAAATGAYPSLDEAIAGMTVFSEPIIPDPAAVPVYEKKYQLYKKALESLDGLWDDMQALVEGK